jgi:hypothetical protein
LELCGPSFIWWDAYSPSGRRCDLTRGKLVSENAPKKRAFQDLAGPAFQNLARTAAEILSLVKQRSGQTLNQEVKEQPIRLKSRTVRRHFINELAQCQPLDPDLWDFVDAVEAPSS